MGEYKMDPKKQFSKRLAKWTAAFWFLYMIWLSVLFYLQPVSAMYAVYMGIIATAVMVLNVYSYTKNSIAEKLILAMLDKTRIELSLGGKASSDTNTEGEEDDDGSGGDCDG